MQGKALILWVVLAVTGAAPLAAADWRGDRPGNDRPGNDRPDGRRRGGPNIIIEPNIDLSRPARPNVDNPEFIMAEIGRCNVAGIRLFVDCLRQNHGSIMIRRLEACVRSETIPDDPQRVAACIPLAPLP